MSISVTLNDLGDQRIVSIYGHDIHLQVESSDYILYESPCVSGTADPVFLSDPVIQGHLSS